MLQLVYFAHQKTQTFDLLEGSYVIGRRPTCAVVIDDASVSGEHIRLDIRANVVEYRDLDSKNGTFVNDVRSSAGCVHAGDRLRLGKYTFEIRQTRHPLAVDGEPAFDEPASGDEVTPEAMEPVTEARAVMVLPPEGRGAVAAPSARVEDAGMPRRRKVMFGVIGGAVVVFILAAMMARPAPAEPAPAPPPRPFNYWDQVRDGIEYFDAKNYERAKALWLAADASQAERSRKYRSARVFADAADRIAAANLGRDEGMDWGTLQARVLEAADDEPEVESFSLRLAGWLRQAGEQQEACRRGEEALLANDYDTATEEFRRVPGDSPFRPRALAGIERIKTARTADARAEAFRLAKARDFEEALAAGAKALAAAGDDEELQNAMVEWRKMIRFRELEHEFLEAADAGRDEIERVLNDILPELPADYVEQAGLARRKEQYERRLFEYRLEDAFEHVNEPLFEELAADGRAIDLPAVARYRSMFEAYRLARERYAEAEKANDFEAMNTSAESLLALPLSEEHPFRQWAEKAKISPERLGALWMTGAARAFEHGRYVEARRRLWGAQQALDIPDMSGHSETLRLTKKAVDDINRRIDAHERRNENDAADRLKDERRELQEKQRQLEETGFTYGEFIALRDRIMMEGRRKFNQAIRDGRNDTYILREGLMAARECFLYSDRDREAQDWIARIQQRYRTETNTDLPPARR